MKLNERDFDEKMTQIRKDYNQNRVREHVVDRYNNLGRNDGGRGRKSNGGVRGGKSGDRGRNAVIRGCNAGVRGRCDGDKGKKYKRRNYLKM